MRRTTCWFIVIAISGVLLLLADILLGSTAIRIADVWAAVTGAEVDPTIRAVVLKFRLPKAAVAVVAGAALSASGLQMQTLFRNPLAGPYVLGISSGASLGVALFLLGMPLLGAAAPETFRNLGMVGAAWIGAAAILVVIMAVSARIRDIMTILILGMMFGSAASAFVDILQYVSSESALKSYVIWNMGSLGGVSTGQLKILSAAAAAGLALSIALIKPLNILLLGENYARTMGLDIRLTRTLIFVGTTLLAGTVTAFCGPVGFIGIAVPHVARMLFAQADHRTLMPASILLGAVVMLLCDVISQMPGTGYTLPINTVTALLGIPIVVVVIVRNRKFF